MDCQTQRPNSQTQRRTWAAMTWETTTARGYGQFIDTDLLNQINELGKQGWELVMVIHDPATISKTAYLKRPKE